MVKRFSKVSWTTVVNTIWKRSLPFFCSLSQLVSFVSGMVSESICGVNPPHSTSMSCLSESKRCGEGEFFMTKAWGEEFWKELLSPVPERVT